MIQLIKGDCLVEMKNIPDGSVDMILFGQGVFSAKLINQITEGNIRASIRMFTPQDDETKVRSIAELVRYGIISSETGSDEAPYSANNEEIRKEKEKEAKIEYERKMDDMRSITTRYIEWLI